MGGSQIHWQRIGELNIREKFNLSIVAILNKDGTKQLYSGPEINLTSDHKVILIGSLEDIKAFLTEENDV